MSRGASYSCMLGLMLGFAVPLLLSTFSAVSWSGLLPPYSTANTAFRRPSFLQHARLFDIPGLHSVRHVMLRDKIHAGAAVSGDDGDNAKGVNLEDLHVHEDDDSVAKDMTRQIRVLVWVMTSPQNVEAKAIHIQNTWGKRANKLLFMSSKWNSSIPAIGLNVSEGRQHLTGKTIQAFSYVYEHHFDDADWFMKADDDTYVIMENLRYMLSAYSSKDPIYFGHAFKVIVKQGYTSGGAGYVISKEALRRLATKGINNAKICRQDGGAEDAEMGKCFMKLGIKLMPSLDRLGRSRFHCFRPEGHIGGGYPKWYRSYDANGAKSGVDSISDYAVSFHYMPPSKMYAMEYFIYHLRPYGIIFRLQSLNLPSNFTAI